MLPWIEDNASLWTLETLAQQLEGETLTGVEYLFPSSRSSCSPYRRGPIDEVDLGVDLFTAGGSIFRAAWEMLGVDQGLLFAPRSEHGDWAMSVRSADVSDYEGWRPLIGRRIATVNLAWQLPEEGAGESVWAVSIDLADGDTVVLALGTILGAAGLTYQPDAVVVIFDREVARGYQIPASSTAEWLASAKGRPVKAEDPDEDDVGRHDDR